MSDLTEMEQRVLAELEEFWKENVFAMLNTIFDPTGDEREVTLLQEALRSLVERDYILMGLEGFFPSNPEKFTKSASLQLLSNLEGWFKFDSQDPHWTLSKGDIKKERIPMIFSTPAGRQKAGEILTQRGYQWWRPKR
jgi:hypothetical protein